MGNEGKPLIALAMGDPAGIGAELAARLLPDADIQHAADILLLGDRRVWALGGEQAGIAHDLDDLDGFAEQGQALSDFAHLDPADITVGQSSEAGGNFALVNDSLCRILGYSRRELLGANYREFTDETNTERIFEAFNDTFRTEQPARRFENEMVRKDGKKNQGK